MEHFLDSYQKHIKTEDILVIAVSGGVDSMVLLDLILENHPHAHIIVAHVDHSLRGAESDGDRELVANFCKSKEIACEIKKIDV